MPEAQARALLQELGLRGRVRLERGGCADPAQAGQVVDQSPPPGQSLPTGSWVDITVCPAPSPTRRVEVPDLGGLEEAQARALLKNAGLGLVVARRVGCAEPQAAGRVIWQAPAAGQQAKRGQRVAVRVCRGGK
jgi:serine/threonine-protein kinase